MRGFANDFYLFNNVILVRDYALNLFGYIFLKSRLLVLLINRLLVIGFYNFIVGILKK